MQDKKVSTAVGTILLLFIAVIVGMLILKIEKNQSVIEQFTGINSFKKPIIIQVPVENNKEDLNQKQEDLNYKNKTKESNRDVSEEKKALNKINIKNSTPESLVTNIYDAIFKSDNNINSRIDQNECALFWKMAGDVKFGFGGWKAMATRQDLSIINEDIDILGDFFVHNGFKKNKDNTFTNSEEEIMYSPGQSFGFEKEKMRCLIKWNQSSPEPNLRYYLDVSCGNYSSENEDNFQTFLNVLGSGTTRFFCVKKRNNYFATGTSSGQGVWHGRKIDGRWKITSSGQDYPICSKVADFPKDFYEKCYDEKNKEIKDAS